MISSPKNIPETTNRFKRPFFQKKLMCFGSFSASQLRRLLLQNHTQVILCGIRDSNQDLQLSWRVVPLRKWSQLMPIWELGRPRFRAGTRWSDQWGISPQYTPFISKLFPRQFTNFVGHPTSTSHLRKRCYLLLGDGKWKVLNRCFLQREDLMNL